MRIQDKATIIDKIRDSKENKIKVAITDIDGILRGKYIHKQKFLSAAESGFGFCNVVFGWDCNDVCYDNSSYTGWHTGYPDAQARIDFSSYRNIPWEKGQSFFLADFESESGEALEVCPRQLLKKIIHKAESMQFTPSIGMEFEWFNFQENAKSLQAKNYCSPEPLTTGMFGYSVLRSSQNKEYFNALMDELDAFGVPLEGLHTETGPGVYEAAILYSDALEAADRSVLFKSGVKEIAQRFEILPSFMAKWDSKLPGCSGHLHQSLRDKNNQNIFYKEQDPQKMSPEFRHYLAGQMHCLPEILPFFAPNINSYKRLVEGLWAPTKVSWGLENRTSAFRVIASKANSTRLETRVGGSDLNPYLAIAAALASGLYGIEKKMELTQAAVSGNAYKLDNAVSLPKNLQAATDKLANSEIAKDIFGEKFVEHFAQTRYWEWRQYEEAVTNWEMERYFEII